MASGNISTRHERAGRDLSYFVAGVRGRCDAARASRDVYSELAGLLEDGGMVIVQERILGSLSVRDAVLAERAKLLDGTPHTYIQGHPVWGEGLAGILVRGVPPSRDVTRIEDGTGRVVGSRWGDGSPTIVLQDIHGLSADGDNDPAAQTRRMLRRARGILTAAGSDYRSVCRTWICLSGILDWYDRFNEARNAEYGEMGMMPGPGSRVLLPASTGIGGDNPHGAACSMDLMAVTDREVRHLSSVGQKDAFEYGSAFSRASAVPMDDGTLLHLSGTAAIDEAGTSTHPGDVKSQIEYTFDRVEMLIGEQGASLGDVLSATVFVKKAEHAPLFEEACRKRGLDPDACVCVVADVCREELMFEMDAELAFGTKER
jgi:enamine deaminase RidA (YjgF/YER057c/UK114 family)